MDRLACVNLPSFPLQVLLHGHPAWRGTPTAVLEEERPQSPILWVDPHARRAGVRPGMRFAAALALAPALNAGCVSPPALTQARDRVTGRLRRFAPDVEPADDPGIFWAGLTGLERLYASPARWADAVRADLGTLGFEATVVTGFTRFGTYAVAHATRGTRSFRDPREERAAALEIPLAHLAIAPEIRDVLVKLNVTTVRDLVRLPEAGLLERFGVKAYRLRQAAGASHTTLRPVAEAAPVRAHRTLDEPETDLSRCLFVFKQMLDPMLATLAARGTALAALEIRLELDRCGPRVEQIRPAAPTLDPVQVLELVRLRLEDRTSASAHDALAGIVEIDLTAVAVPATHEQLRFFGSPPHRDLIAGNRALARLRAEFGEQAVVRARLRDGHLPEARVTWEPVRALTPPSPSPGRPGTLVRRIWARPEPAAPAATRQHDGWLILGTGYGAVEDLLGPYIVSGGWWVREVDRAYHFAQTRRGDLLWVYHDRLRRRWFLHGRVE